MKKKRDMAMHNFHKPGEIAFALQPTPNPPAQPSPALRNSGRQMKRRGNVVQDEEKSKKVSSRARKWDQKVGKERR